MRRWIRASMHLFCGGPCGRLVHKGEPMLELSSPAWSFSHPKLRCVACAGEPPPDLPPLIERTPIQPTATRLPLRTMTGLPADFKRAASGEREPGEEG